MATTSPKKAPFKGGRLRILLAAGKVKGVDLAKDTGTSYPLFLAVNRGVRRLTVNYAKRIAAATGVSAEWLLGKGSKNHPVTADKRPFTPETYKAWKTGQVDLWRNPWITLSSTSNGQDPAFEVEGASLPYFALQASLWEFARLFVTASRKGRMGVLQDDWIDFCDSRVEALKLESFFPKETVGFLPHNPFAQFNRETQQPTKKSQQVPKELDFYDQIRAGRKASDPIPEHAGKSLNIASTLNPLFLFQLGELISLGEKNRAAKMLGDAEEALVALRKTLKIRNNPPE